MASYDAVVIGGGIIGCAIGWRLAQAGQRVALLERGHVGDEASSAAGGIFIPEAEPGVALDLVHFWSASNALYPSFVEEVRAATGHAFEFRVAGRLVAALDDAEVAELQVRYAQQEPAGIRARWLNGADARAMVPALAPATRAAIFFPDHGLVDNPRLTRALGAAFAAAGGALFENRGALGLVYDGSRVAGVATATGPLTTPVVVNAAGSWSGRLDPRALLPVGPAKGQMLAVDRGALRIECLVAGAGGGSAVPRATGETLIGATVQEIGFDKDVVFNDVIGLFERAARLLPDLRRCYFQRTWAGLRPVTPDHRPVVGPDPRVEGLYWATGHFTMGILCAPITAQAVSELILRGESSVPIAGFGPDRLVP
jgi:glycine oxidase